MNYSCLREWYLDTSKWWFEENLACHNITFLVIINHVTVAWNHSEVARIRHYEDSLPNDAKRELTLNMKQET